MRQVRWQQQPTHKGFAEHSDGGGCFLLCLPEKFATLAGLWIVLAASLFFSSIAAEVLCNVAGECLRGSCPPADGFGSPGRVMKPEASGPSASHHHQLPAATTAQRATGTKAKAVSQPGLDMTGMH
ncbi:hypothetical protein HaLaN_09496 [Haematococcus lacustris]|uniref:Uncharacterized protein n=1 Tax=Haematococcus lacustris TaxID=44745 RepID=A0A699Z287_HAELA|nr:hypothetical protein HaLaN_09496 [Haematococcus lacustris]